MPLYKNALDRAVHPQSRGHFGKVKGVTNTFEDAMWKRLLAEMCNRTEDWFKTNAARLANHRLGDAHHRNDLLHLIKQGECSEGLTSQQPMESPLVRADGRVKRLCDCRNAPLVGKIAAWLRIMARRNEVYDENGEVTHTEPKLFKIMGHETNGVIHTRECFNGETGEFDCDCQEFFIHLRPNRKAMSAYLVKAEHAASLERWKYQSQRGGN